MQRIRRRIRRGIIEKGEGMARGITFNIKRIANHYGYDRQAYQCIEEMAELTQAICKYDRAKNAEEKQKAFYQLVEEIADVEIMIAQLKHLTNAEMVQNIHAFKIDRQLHRIEKEKMQHD